MPLLGRQFATYSSSNCTLTLHSTPPTMLSLPPVESLFSLPSEDGDEFIIGITPDFSIVQVHIKDGLTLNSHNCLPIPRPKKILPVDPMAWGLSHPWVAHDVLLSISDCGELAFWVPEDSKSHWRCTGKVRTKRTGIKKARCSSAKKTALSWYL